MSGPLYISSLQAGKGSISELCLQVTPWAKRSGRKGPLSPWPVFLDGLFQGSCLTWVIYSPEQIFLGCDYNCSCHKYFLIKDFKSCSLKGSLLGKHDLSTGRTALSRLPFIIFFPCESKYCVPLEAAQGQLCCHMLTLPSQSPCSAMRHSNKRKAVFGLTRNPRTVSSFELMHNLNFFLSHLCIN